MARVTSPVRVDGVLLNIVPATDNFPDLVVVMHQRWSVLYCDNLVEAKAAHGLTVYQDRTIYIDSNLAYDGKVDTLLHEVMHVIMDLGETRCWLPQESEEYVIRSISPKILDFLRGNNTEWMYSEET